VKEAPVEKRLKTRLEGEGFKVLKLVTEGTAGATDRLILRPLWSPGVPWFAECKRPGKDLRLLQATIANDWRRRGCKVWSRAISSYEDVQEIYEYLMDLCNKERTDGR